ncbi:SDR family oxidoreductase [Reichenbachiella sp. MALMAid0571]|uniref:SDR family NAD(P)-dependent oxidoreductase n=1 Tax=Reichenbachiella sp. MALMAid0571 TaxID=3143939 RepID=UPI0032DE608F
MQLANKVAVITGGASGIGLAITQLFASNGAHVHVLELNENVTIDAEGDVKIHQCNVANQSQVNQVLESIVKEHDIDILVNNAGIAHVGKIENTNEEDMDRLYNVNIKGVFNCIKGSLDSLKKTKGVILNMASIASSIGIPDRFAYSMTKGAVLTMTYSVAKDYLADGIRCNCISPARVHTPFVDGFIAKNYPGQEKEMFEKLSKSQPIGRMGKPSEIAELALFLCSDKAGFITGTDYPIDGGFIKLSN